MSKAPSEGTQAVERLLQERRQIVAWLARIDATADATPEHVRTRVRADYVARLAAVTEELATHAAAAQQLIGQRKEMLAALMKKEKQNAERLAETELRHAVGEYDEVQWSRIHEDALAELVAVREEVQGVKADIQKLAELDRLVRQKPGAAPSASAAPGEKRPPVDELAFLKSVTEDDRAGPSPKRASGATYQPDVPELPSPGLDDDLDAQAPKTLKCADCGTMNLATEWYCERCGSELAAL